MAQPLAVRLDDVGGGVLYVGEAEPGWGPDTAKWRIKRLTEVAGLLDIQFASGSDAFTHIWDDRLSLNYS